MHYKGFLRVAYGAKQQICHPGEVGPSQDSLSGAHCKARRACLCGEEVIGGKLPQGGGSPVFNQHEQNDEKLL